MSPGWLLAEAARRARVLASFADPPTGTDPPVGGEPPVSDDRPRSARDLAFALGHGLYETMLQLARTRPGTAATR